MPTALQAKGGSSIWTRKVYHMPVGIANTTLYLAKVPQKGNVRETKEGYWQNP